MVRGQHQQHTKVETTSETTAITGGKVVTMYVTIEKRENQEMLVIQKSTVVMTIRMIARVQGITKVIISENEIILIIVDHLAMMIVIGPLLLRTKIIAMVVVGVMNDLDMIPPLQIQALPLFVYNITTAHSISGIRNIMIIPVVVIADAVTLTLHLLQLHNVITIVSGQRTMKSHIRVIAVDHGHVLLPRHDLIPVKEIAKDLF